MERVKLSPRDLALRAVRAADWTYNHSDDPKYYRAGLASTAHARHMCKLAGLDVDEARKIMGVGPHRG